MTEETSPAPKKRYTRELTALVLIPLAIWIVGWAPLSVYIGAAVVITAVALWEFVALGAAKGYPVQPWISVALGLLILTTFVRDDISVEVGVFATLLIIPAVYVFSRSPLEEALPASAVCTLGTLYIAMLTGALLRLRVDFPLVGSRLVFFLMLVVWAGDAGAYYVGRKFGKRKLSPRVSPKKTVEGSLGGVMTSMLMGAAIHFTFFPEFPLVHAVIAAAILSAAGIVGDLAESLWKRSAAVKDSGTILPGHGGFLDRFDSVLFTAPLMYAYWYVVSGRLF